MEKLPEKWAIKRTKESYKILNNYFNEGCKSKSYTSKEDNWYFHYPNFKSYVGFYSGKHIDDIILSDYIEITFEDFKRLVLKENVERNYELW